MKELDKLDHQREFDECYEKLKLGTGHYKKFGPETLFFAAKCLRWRVLLADDKATKQKFISEGLEITKFAYETYPDNAKCIAVSWLPANFTSSGTEYSLS